MDNALFNFLLRLARRDKPNAAESAAGGMSNEAAVPEPADPPTVSLRDIATSELAANYIVVQHEMTDANELLLVGTPLFLVYEKLGRELYRRAIQQSDLSVQVDGRHYLIAPKAHNQIELIEIQH